MKKATEYAKRVKAWWESIRLKVDPPSETEPLAVLILALLSKSTTVQRAVDALTRLRNEMVDFNELRVTTESEVVDLLGARYPDAHAKASDVSKSLGYLFETEHSVSLAHVVAKPRKDQRAELLKIPGVNSYAASVVLLQALGHPAVPLDEDVLAAMQTEDLLPRDIDLEEANLWMERQVDKDDAHAFWITSKLWVTGELDAAAQRSSKAKAARASAKAAAKRTAGAEHPQDGENPPADKKPQASKQPAKTAKPKPAKDATASKPAKPKAHANAAKDAAPNAKQAKVAKPAKPTAKKKA